MLAHRSDCNNIKSQKEEQRLIEVRMNVRQ